MSRRGGVWAGAMALWLAGCATPADRGPQQGVRLNEVQFIGTHNSYHVAPDQAVFDLMLATGYRESDEWTAERLVPALSFTHPPLQTQLDRGLRLFELDVHHDPNGGLFTDPGFLRALAPAVAAKTAPVDPNGELARPGFKVFHTVDTDVRSTCLRFVLCLQEIRAWSIANPGHLPIFIQIEIKEGRKPALSDAYMPAPTVPFDRDAWARLHAEIRSVFSDKDMFSPAELRGEFASVNAAVRARGWPAADALAGQVIFMLLDDSMQQRAYAEFTADVGAALLHLSIAPNDPSTGWLIRPNPYSSEIPALVASNFLVYTRADANSTEPRRADLSRARAAIASGAQLISTDHPWPTPQFGAYAVSFDGAFVRCSRAAKPQNC